MPSNNDVNVTRFEFDRLYKIVDDLLADQTKMRVEMATMKLTIRLLIVSASLAGASGGGAFALLKHFFP